MLRCAKKFNPATGITERVIVEHKIDYHPQIIILDKKRRGLWFISCTDRRPYLGKGRPGGRGWDNSCKDSSCCWKNKGYHRWFAACCRVIRSASAEGSAIISEIDGFVEFGETKKGQRQIVVRSPTGMKREYAIPHGKHPNVYKGDKVAAGQQLTDGPIVPQDIYAYAEIRYYKNFLLMKYKRSIVFRVCVLTISILK